MPSVTCEMLKKKRKTFAARSNEASKGSDCSYTLPATYEIFLAELKRLVGREIQIQRKPQKDLLLRAPYHTI